MLVRSIDELEEHARLRREGPVLQLFERLAPEYRLKWVEPPRSVARAGGSGIGASRPLPRVPANVP
jgi:hypothetical protein